MNEAPKAEISSTNTLMIHHVAMFPQPAITTYHNHSKRTPADWTSKYDDPFVASSQGHRANPHCQCNHSLDLKFPTNGTNDRRLGPSQECQPYFSFKKMHGMEVLPQDQNKSSLRCLEEVWRAHSSNEFALVTSGNPKGPSKSKAIFCRNAVFHVLALWVSFPHSANTSAYRTCCNMYITVIKIPKGLGLVGRWSAAKSPALQRPQLCWQLLSRLATCSTPWSVAG